MSAAPPASHINGIGVEARLMLSGAGRLEPRRVETPRSPFDGDTAGGACVCKEAP